MTVSGNEHQKIQKRFDIGTLREWATNGVNTALRVQQPVAVSTVARLRRVHPDKSPEQLIKFLNNTYLGTVTASGTGAGVASVVPNGAVQAPVTLADLLAFLESSVWYVLTMAEIYGMDVEDIERRRFLVMTAFLGNSGVTTATQALGKKSIPYWSKTIINKIPMGAIQTANKALGPRFITKYGTKQGLLVLGKQIPLGLGAIVGAAGNATFGYFIVRSTKKVLGEAPANWDHLQPKETELVEVEIVDEAAADPS
ncbi:hypothetical protein [uncultured Varibaculum sp.]|uniref:hypothetical protein n=1 Tax=uncultured Varibaculum sp. TaxID=413896 RepID=UPI00258AFFE3|nr:hypothetical protein [uncultured Varibaculum sp.]